MTKHIQPLVSVVIACYNHEKFVQESLQSVINQTYQNIELMIIDDGSSDGSTEEIKKMIAACEQRFTRFEFRSRPNKGLSLTLNEALEWCQGKYFSGVASDDVILKEKIKMQVKYLEEHQQCVAVFGGYYLIDDQGNTISSEKSPDCVYDFKDILVHRHNLPAPTQMIVLNSILMVGGYKPEIIIEDWYMWLKLAHLGELHYVSEYFSKYRTHSNNISKKINIMHHGRLQVISDYKNNALYVQAKKQVFWIYLCELKGAGSKGFLLDFLKYFITHPFFVFRKYFKEH